MALNPRKLLPSELIQLLNSTPLGQVLDSGLLYRHRLAAGLNIGDGKRVDLLRYCVWLRQQCHKPRKAVRTYEDIKRAAIKKSRQMAEIGREVGPLPKVANSRLKSRAKKNFRYFCERYFPQTFYLPWSRDHHKIIARIEKAVMRGGLFALAMPRGYGKSALTERACLWALLYGHHRFVMLIGASEAQSEEMLDSIKTELEGNDLLLADFPEACHCIRELDGISQRASGQILDGKRTYIGWTNKEIIFPTIPRRASSSAIIRITGITGRVRGMKYTTHDGYIIRPSLVVIDDPQTDESARSPSQCAQRLSILAGAILNLAGPGQKISGVMPCTVIRPNDMADQILDRDKHPAWQGERTKMVYKFPENDKLWDEYFEVLTACWVAGDDISRATEFYRKHRKAMDKGADVAWDERYNPDELSAIQHAMNLKFRNEAAFYAEHQNEPMTDIPQAAEAVTVDDVMHKLNRHKRGVVPIECTHLTMYIDIMQDILFYMVCGWADNFSGAIVDYGTFPDQQRPFFRLTDIRNKLKTHFPKSGTEGAIYGGLEALTTQLMTLEWPKDDGSILKIERGLIDANWHKSTDVVYQFCRQSSFAGMFMPSHGRGVRASGKPIGEWTKKPGERIGLNWIIPVAGKRVVRHVIYDTNFWKSFIHSRLAVQIGDRGCLSIFGDEPNRHRLLAEHVCAEYSVPTSARGRLVDEWYIRPQHFDNHWFDGLVGCAVAASIMGVELAEIGEAGSMGARKKSVIPKHLLRNRNAR